MVNSTEPQPDPQQPEPQRTELPREVSAVSAASSADVNEEKKEGEPGASSSSTASTTKNAPPSPSPTKSTKTPSPSCPTTPNGSHCQRRGILKAMIDHFSSTPLDLEAEDGADAPVEGGGGEEATTTTLKPRPAAMNNNSILSSSGRGGSGRHNSHPHRSVSVLTESERDYLEGILHSGDLPSIEAASLRLTDRTLFPEEAISSDEDNDNGEVDNSNAEKGGETPSALLGVGGQQQRRRDSLIQQELFRLHETGAVRPSRVLQGMALQHHNSILDSSATMAAVTNSILMMDESVTNSILDFGDLGMDDTDNTNRSRNSFFSSGGVGTAAAAAAVGASPDDDEAAVASTSSPPDDWNPFKDIAGWLDGSEGVEVDDDGVPMGQQGQLPGDDDEDGEGGTAGRRPGPPNSRINKRTTPFKILGTAADDVSCHPHVLSPPLMESLLAFVPESLSETNLWLKYSLVRDGSSLWKMLRQVRASHHCLLAIETTEGHVFGAFTSQAWRLSQGWYGSNDSFLWRMRKSRCQKGNANRSLLEQIYQESEVQVYPFRSAGNNVAVQHCTKQSLMLGQGELLPSEKYSGEHFGHAIQLRANLTGGTTSTSETFGNPCLVDSERRGAEFEISNLEVWTLTPHSTVADAERSELSTLFLEGGHGTEKSLNLVNILVGGTI